MEVNKSSSVLGEEVLGGTIYTYTLHIENFGQTDADQLIVTDQLDGDVDFIGNAKKMALILQALAMTRSTKRCCFIFLETPLEMWMPIIILWIELSSACERHRHRG